MLPKAYLASILLRTKSKWSTHAFHVLHHKCDVGQCSDLRAAQQVSAAVSIISRPQNFLVQSIDVSVRAGNQCGATVKYGLTATRTQFSHIANDQSNHFELPEAGSSQWDEMHWLLIKCWVGLAKEQLTHLAAGPSIQTE